MKKIVISQRIDWVDSHQEYRDSLDRRLIEYVTSFGYQSIPFPNFKSISENSLSHIDSYLDAIVPDGIILSGGNDIGQFLDRDFTENRILDYAIPRHIPVLGICRGMQVIGVKFGSSLFHVDGHAGTRHNVVGKYSLEVNSFHNYSLVSSPSGFEITAVAKDGHIEAFLNTELRIAGWMWHPERATSNAESMRQEFVKLFE